MLWAMTIVLNISINGYIIDASDCWYVCNESLYVTARSKVKGHGETVTMRYV